MGEDPREGRRLWQKLARAPALQWVGRAGITQLALAAVDVALWDLRAKSAGVPLWHLLGGPVRERLAAYNTDVGWLSFADQALVDGCRRAVEIDGFHGIKIKVGHDSARRRPPTPRGCAPRDRRGRRRSRSTATAGGTCRRASASARGPKPSTCTGSRSRSGTTTSRSHAALARATSIPVALGEQLYTADAFEGFMAAGAVHYVQPDVTRLGGVTEFLQVADAAHARRLPVAAHAGDMSQVHVHLSYAHPATSVLEYIPWIKDHFVEPIRVVDGCFVRPQVPGAGMTPTADALARFARPLA